MLTAAPQAEPIRSEFASDPEYTDLLEMFTRALPQRKDSLRGAWQAGQTQKLRVLAHQLKGAGGGFGFEGLTRLAADLEQACKRSDVAGVGTALDQLLAYMDRIAL